MSSSNPDNFEEHSWSTGLCGCFDDVKSCCITFWCPCITFGQISEILDKVETCEYIASGYMSTNMSRVSFHTIVILHLDYTSACVMNCAIYMLIHCLTSCACLYSCC
ncbi:hypothetical protein BT93_B1045 [Corymbia citriodora subsp. variegata]|nr:hypothetical protein BT93_B1045 [Corymbia citriodora subsp. variegata]